MAVSNIEAFWLKAKNDPKLQMELRSLQGGDLAESARKVATMAARYGFMFTAEEYEKAIQKNALEEHAAGDELSDDDLENVAGGLNRRRRMGAADETVACNTEGTGGGQGTCCGGGVALC